MPDIDLFEGLTGPQAEAVGHVDGPLLVVAGAGSGKTRVITRRAANIARSAARADQILAITFTNKAAGEMRERIISLGAGRGMWICTFHSMCARLLREFGDRVGLEANFSIMDQADARSLVKQAIADCDLNVENWPPGKMLERISKAKSSLLTPAQFLETAYDFTTKTVAHIYEAYQTRLAAQNACDFDDLLMHMATMLMQQADVRAMLSDRFRYILIDEYQDTNMAQYQIANRLAEAHRNICATGDPDQSIYAWRGADLQNILDFEKDYPDATVVRLEQNFRSTGAILAGASELISRNDFRRHKALWTDGEVGAPIRVWTCDDERTEARTVARDIRAFIDEGGEAGDIAIFYRVNALSRAAEDALRAEGLPYQIARGVEFYNRKEIKDVLAWLRLISNPADETAFLRAISTPSRGIGKVSLERLKSHAAIQGITMDAAARDAMNVPALKAAARKVADFAKLIESLRQMPDRPVAAVVSAVLSKSGIESSLRAAEDMMNDPLRNVQELVTAAHQYDDDNPEGTLIDWLQQTSLVNDTDSIEAAGGRVTLMTLHAAKGLEFPQVYIIGMEEGLLPHARTQTGEQSELEEERRLAFVGMTRGMYGLTLSHAMYRSVRGITERAVASRFLSELPDDNVERTTIAEERDRSQRHLRQFNEPQLTADGTYYPGCRVRHELHGVGEVLGVETRLRSRYVRIHFPSVGRLSINLDHATLYILD